MGNLPRGLRASIRFGKSGWQPGCQRTGLKFKDRNFLILTLALISSQSTTGYLIYALMVTGYYIAYKKWNPAYMAIGGCIFIGSMSLPFMQAKIVELFQNSQNMEQQLRNMEYSTRHGTDSEDIFYVPQRFDGFMFQSINLAHANKFIGEGRNFQNFYLNKELGYPIVVSEGLLNVFIRYGWIIGLFMYLAFFRLHKRTLSRKRKHPIPRPVHRTELQLLPMGCPNPHDIMAMELLGRQTIDKENNKIITKG